VTPSLNKYNCLQPLQIPYVEHELVPPPCASAKSNTNRTTNDCQPFSWTITCKVESE